MSFAVFFAVLLFLGSLFEKLIGSELLFLGVGVGLGFFCGFFLGFCFTYWRVWKNSLDVRSVLFVFVLSSIGFFVAVAFVFPLFLLFRETKFGW